MELSFSDYLAIILTLVGIAVSFVFYYLQKRPSDRVNQAVLDENVRNENRKTYHLNRLRGYTQLIRNELLSFEGIYERHRLEPTSKSWKNVVAIAERNSKQVEAAWKVAEYDISRIRDLVNSQYLVDKYYDVNIYLTMWTYQRIIDKMAFDEKLLLDGKQELDQQLAQLDKTIELIDTEAKAVS